MLANALAIGVTEELTFRYSLHRLWARYGPAFYIPASSLAFGFMHLPGGATVIAVTTALGVVFAMARVAGVPIIILIVVHGLVDIPGVMAYVARLP